MKLAHIGKCVFPAKSAEIKVGHKTFFLIPITFSTIPFIHSSGSPGTSLWNYWRCILGSRTEDLEQANNTPNQINQMDFSVRPIKYCFWRRSFYIVLRRPNSPNREMDESCGRVFFSTSNINEFNKIMQKLSHSTSNHFLSYIFCFTFNKVVVQI